MSNHIKIQGTSPRLQYVADGKLNAYEFPFVIFNPSDINVYFNDKVQDSDTYTVAINKNTEGGEVSFETAPASGTIITIVRNLAIKRTTSFQEGGALRAKVLNNEFDYQMACQQQIADSLNRSMVLPPYAVDTDVDLTLPTPSAGKAIVWNKDGTNLENSTVAVNALESTLRGYKESAESASTTAIAKADIATTQASIATAKAEKATATLINKANVSLDNLNNVGKKSIAQLPLPSPSYVDLTLEASGTEYTAPASGYITFVKLAVTAHKNVSIESNGWFNISWSHGADLNISTFMPVQRGEKFIVSYSAEGSVERFRLIYAQGEV